MEPRLNSNYRVIFLLTKAVCTLQWSVVRINAL